MPGGLPGGDVEASIWLVHKQRSHKQNQCPASDSAGLIFTRLYYSTLLITTLSFVKTSLKALDTQSTFVVSGGVLFGYLLSQKPPLYSISIVRGFPNGAADLIFFSERSSVRNLVCVWKVLIYQWAHCLAFAENCGVFKIWSEELVDCHQTVPTNLGLSVPLFSSFFLGGGGGRGSPVWSCFQPILNLID